MTPPSPLDNVATTQKMLGTAHIFLTRAMKQEEGDETLSPLLLSVAEGLERLITDMMTVQALVAGKYEL